FDELNQAHPKNHFTVGIIDDVSFSSLPWDETFRTEANASSYQAIFYGLGSDGTVSANKNSIKLIGGETDLHVQGYFVYDSKKSGAVTISHLRFGPEPIHSTYLIEDGEADFVACHQQVFLERYNMLDKAAEKSVFLLNSSLSGDDLWQRFPHKMQQQIIDKQIQVYVIDAYAVANDCGMGKRINTIMQTCFFTISKILPLQQALKGIKQAVQLSYGKKGQALVELNFKAIDEALTHLHTMIIPDAVSSDFEVQAGYMDRAPAFVQQVTAEMIAGRGDQIPVSMLPADGSYPVGTTAYEKRNLALEIPVLDQELCTQCGKCPLVCPHAAIRSKIFLQSALIDPPASFKYKPTIGKGFPEGMQMAYQVAPEDCTGCGLCVDICPIRDKQNPEHKALNMAPQPPLREQEKLNWEYFLSLPEYDRRALKIDTIKGAMVLQPLFEFSGACMGCGETPYIKLVTQLFGDRMVVANATGCSSIFGGNLPTTPWTCNAEGRGPAWNNSLFEDNAEFGLGMRVAIDKHKQQAEELLLTLKQRLDDQLVDDILSARQEDEAGIFEQRQRVEQLQQQLKAIDSEQARRLAQLAENLCRKSVWIIGGDGWAYDIGYGGLDHVLASGRDVNILVLDTEVYSNTGGQTSKATPRGAIARFSAAGKPTAKKELGLLAMDYENVYVAHIAYGAKDVQTLRALLEAEAHHGPSIVIAYAPCISHGVDMANNHQHQQMAVNSGHWPLFRFDPKKIQQGENPLKLDSQEPSVSYREFMEAEPRFSMLWQTHPDLAEQNLVQAQQEVNHRYHFYKQLSELDWDDDTSVASSRMKYDKRTPVKGDK
ncbi:MAG: pyruvate:ferredoxin (flavodoxin) oxidoreductase, partial [Gammaproteobacteria bacterium]|nr:pyruvate:ferredoxin (flavodoxin) oxidoreductase [Gammaproteobacteria bacterium]